MNYLKYRANRLRSRIDPDNVDERLVRRIETWLDRAQKIRDLIIQANMRLVISIVKKFVSPRLSFDDRLSDGVLTLMQAVEKFDYDRGFRFSTYAYRSIVRNAYRTSQRQQEDDRRWSTDGEDWLFHHPEDSRSSALEDRVWDGLRSLAGQFVARLNRREQFIIRSRYALGAHRRSRTFQELADRLGVSKERVRQLEQRAMSKLKTMAAACDLDELFGAAMV